MTKKKRQAIPSELPAGVNGAPSPELAAAPPPSTPQKATKAKTPAPSHLQPPSSPALIICRNK